MAGAVGAEALRAGAAIVAGVSDIAHALLGKRLVLAMGARRADAVLGVLARREARTVAHPFLTFEAKLAGFAAHSRRTRAKGNSERVVAGTGRHARSGK